MSKQLVKDYIRTYVGNLIDTTIKAALGSVLLLLIGAYDWILVYVVLIYGLSVSRVLLMIVAYYTVELAPAIAKSCKFIASHLGGLL